MLRRAPPELMPVPAKERDSAPMLRLPPALFVVSSKAAPLTITVPLLVVPRPLLFPTRMAPALFVTMPVKVLAPLRKRVAAPDLVMFVPAMIPLRMTLLEAVSMLAVSVWKVRPKLIVWRLVERLVSTPGPVRIKAEAVALVPLSTNAPALVAKRRLMLTLAVPSTARLFVLVKPVVPAKMMLSAPFGPVPPQFVAADQLPLVEAPWPVHVLVTA